MAENKEKNNKKKSLKDIVVNILLIIALLAILGTAVYYTIQKHNKQKENSVAYSQLLKDIDEEKIQKIELNEASQTALLSYKKDIEKDNKVPEDKKKNSTIPNTQAFMELVNQKIASGKTVEIEQKSKSLFARFMKGFTIRNSSLPIEGRFTAVSTISPRRPFRTCLTTCVPTFL